MNNTNINNTIFGTDIAYNVLTNDLYPIDSLTSGNALVGQRIARMLTTPTGALASIDPDVVAQSWGFDCTRFINGSFTPTQKSQIQAQIVNAINMDPDIQNSKVVFNVDNFGLVTIACTIYTAIGPFQLVLNINNVTSAVVFNEGVLGNQ